MIIILEMAFVLKYANIHKSNYFLVLKNLKRLWSQAFQTSSETNTCMKVCGAVDGVHRDASDYGEWVNHKCLHHIKTAAWWSEETPAAIGSQLGAAMSSHLVIVRPGEDTGWHEWAKRPTLKPQQHGTKLRRKSTEKETGGETRKGICHRRSRRRHWFGAQGYRLDGFGWGKRLNL